MLAELAQKVTVTLVFSIMANVGVEKIPTVHITNKEPPKSALMELERKMPILYTPSWRKVYLCFICYKIEPFSIKASKVFTELL